MEIYVLIIMLCVITFISSCSPSSVGLLALCICFPGVAWVFFDAFLAAPDYFVTCFLTYNFCIMLYWSFLHVQVK